MSPLPPPQGALLLRHDDRGPAAGHTLAPVVLLHGAVQTRAVWERQVAALAPLRRVIVPDLRGHGQTPLGTGELTVGGMADDVLRLLAHLGVRRCVVCGVSLGGMVALEMAARDPGRIRSLVLANTPRALSGVAWLRRALRAADPQRLLFPAFAALGRERTARLGLALARVLVGPHWVGKTARRHFVAGFSAMSDEAIVAVYGAIVAYRPVDLGRILCPCLVVDGSKDAAAIREQAKEIGRQTRRGRRVVMRAGHVAMLDDPETFNRILLAALGDADRDPAGGMQPDGSPRGNRLRG